jgi:hypothetical protein
LIYFCSHDGIYAKVIILFLSTSQQDQVLNEAPRMRGRLSAQEHFGIHFCYKNTGQKHENMDEQDNEL